MANKKSPISTLEKNRASLFQMGCKIHDEVLKTSNLLIDETFNTISKSQKIAGKIIKNGEPIVAKQIDMTIETIAEIKGQAEKSGKRALKLLGMTKQYNKLTKTISKKVDSIPTAEEMVDTAKDYVANAKSDVEKTITKATKSIKKTADSVEKTVESKVAELSKEIKQVIDPKAKTAKKVVAKKIAKTVKAKKTVAKKVTAKKVVAKKTPAKKVVAKKVVAKKATPAKKAIKTSAPVAKVTAPLAQVVKAKAPIAKVVKAESTTDLTKIKGIGPSLANIMTQNGITSIADLKNATPDALKIVTAKAGNRYASFDTKLWIEAANSISK